MQVDIPYQGSGPKGLAGDANSFTAEVLTTKIRAVGEDTKSLMAAVQGFHQKPPKSEI